MEAKVIPRFEVHSHSMYSNLRLVDATNRPEKLMEYAAEIGLAGCALTDHESLGAHVELDQLQERFKEEHPGFKIVRGNEIYLTDTRDTGQYYYHHILIALDAIGHKMLRQLSSQAWINSYFDRGMERVPTLKSEVEEVIQKYGQGHIHASAACLAGEVNHNLALMIQAERVGDTQTINECHHKIVDFVQWCIKTYGKDNFTLEIAPGRSEEQLAVNTRMPALAKAFGLPIVIGTDAHYLKKEDRYVHKAFLNSKEGEREVDSFYSAAYLQTEEEIRENLAGTGLDYEELCANSMKIYDKCQYYTLARKQHVTEVDVPFYPKEDKEKHRYDPREYPVLDRLMHSDNLQERYWVNYCGNKLIEKHLENPTYLARLEKEADIMSVVGEKLETCVFAYPNFLQHYMDLIWECGSPIGVGRGSAGAGLNHYLEGLTQLEPIKHHFMYERFLNKERIEMPDVDIDVSPSLRPKILEKIREERGPLGCIQVCTYGTISTKAAIKVACRGYRSQEYPDGIELEEAEYISSLIPSERGFLWTLKDCFDGNKEKGRKPVTNFVNAVQAYPGLKDILLGIEGLISQRGVHASGVCFFDNDDPYDNACFMKAKEGSIITQWSLHPQEYCGSVKYDFLVTEQMDIIAQCIHELQEHHKIDDRLTLREAYDKYIHPDVLPMQDKKLWDAIDSTNIVALFQLNSQVGSQTVKKLIPRDIETLNDCNGIMRLMAGDDGISPTDRYADMKQHPQKWEQEMDSYGLTAEDKDVIKEYVSCGVLIDQETLMKIVMDKRVCGFSLAESNALRKTVAKFLALWAKSGKTKILIFI